MEPASLHLCSEQQKVPMEVLLAQTSTQIINIWDLIGCVRHIARRTVGLSSIWQTFHQQANPVLSSSTVKLLGSQSPVWVTRLVYCCWNTSADSCSPLLWAHWIVSLISRPLSRKTAAKTWTVLMPGTFPLFLSSSFSSAQSPRETLGDENPAWDLREVRENGDQTVNVSGGSKPVVSLE